ncbi:glycosyl transferase [Sphingomonas lenta]|uniref:Glycosyl transferase n=1 Tax=Sphingomonas lenta TaxID=1141887 RepID=A0A2A2SKL8_9SPHN|nr:glycosyl transferase [Sphingomonas lenta]
MSGGGKHIAVVAPPVPGHFRPLSVLAEALGERGHRVTFVHMADARALVGGGAAFHAVGQAGYGPGALERYGRRLARASGPVGLPAMIRASAGITRMLLDELPGTLERIGAEAVVAEAAEPAGALVARKLGLPHVTSHTGLPLNREPLVPPPYLGWSYRDDARGLERNAWGYRVSDWLLRPIDGAVARAAEAWGLEPEPGFSPLLQVAQCVTGLDFPRRALPPSFRYCGPFRDPPEAADLPDEPLVFCSLGSLQGDRLSVFRAMARACADLKLRAVIGHGGLLSEADAARIGSGALVRAYWPQEAVLARSVAAVLHGGFNTVMDALAAGVPSVIAPIAFEQPATAARVAHAGAGRVVGTLLTRGEIRRELERVIADPSYARAAGELGEEIARSGGAALAADLIDEALTTERTPVHGSA